VLIAVDDPDAFTSDTPTAALIRQILGAVSQFETASLVAKLAGARFGKRQANGRCEGRGQPSRRSFMGIANGSRRRHGASVPA
jgi:hypothetical protein